MKLGISIIFIIACLILLLNITGVMGGNPIITFIAAFGLIMIVGLISAVVFASKRKKQH